MSQAAALERWKQDFMQKRWSYLATFFFAGYILLWFLGDALSSSILAAREGVVLVDDYLLPGVVAPGGGGGANARRRRPSSSFLGDGDDTVDDLHPKAVDDVVAKTDDDDDPFSSEKTPGKDRRKRIPLKFTKPPLPMTTTSTSGGGEGKPRRTRVCTVALNPRQGSIFRTNLMAMYGSGKYTYVVKRDCPWQMPRVRLIAFVKCCVSPARVHSTINFAIQTDDVVVLTGDEYCLINDARPHFRQYYSTSVIGKATTRWKAWNGTKEMGDANGTYFPLYLPLGPREEFERVDQSNEVVAASSRRFVYNFLGSMTSYSRQVLRKVVDQLATPDKQAKFRSFIHITDKWHLKVTTSNGYVDPSRYRRILLDSVFTLCPTGHNPEAYRIFEALEAGSIPVLSLDRWYNRHSCDQAFRPFREAGAPFVYLNGGWHQFESFLEKRARNQTWIDERQAAVREWYAWFMHRTALRFENVLETRFRNRMARKRTKKDLEMEQSLSKGAEEDDQAIAKHEAENAGKEEEEEEDEGAAAEDDGDDDEPGRRRRRRMREENLA